MEELEILINKKKSNQTFTHEDAEVLAAIINDNGSRNDDLCAFLESLNVSNFSVRETADLALEIAKTGTLINIAEKIGPCVSKDNAGYVSDSVSLVVMSVLASLGVKTVKLANSKYGAFGNTVSKLAMFDGFDANVSEDKFISIAEKVGCSIFENKGTIAPADSELVTIMQKFVCSSIPMLAVSFLAKKIALGASTVIFDIKSGEGGLVKNNNDAYKLGKYLVDASKLAGLQAACIVTTLNQPTSASIGGVAEIKEVIRSMSSGDAYFGSDLMTVAKEIVEVALILSGAAKGRSDAGEMFDDAVTSGKALSKFREIVLAFGGRFESAMTKSSLLDGVATSYVEATNAGYLADVDTQGLYESYQILSGAKQNEDIDKNAAIVMLVREGARVEVGDKIARVLYSFDNDNYPLALPGIREALCVKAQKPKREKLLVKVFV